MGFSVPTSDVGVLPHVFGFLETQVDAMNMKVLLDDEETPQQSVAATVGAVFTAVVLVATGSVVDAAIHVASFVVKVPFVFVRETIGTLTGLDKYMPEAFNGEDWLNHANKTYKCAVLFINSFLIGIFDPETVLAMGRRFNMMSKPVEKETELVESVSSL
ncbi:MAG: hypothetical protein JSR46_11925 [Verrucomicrobia bacterium]|nr:hypothetical protein [Verrucomicrobiota bacterium]